MITSTYKKKKGPSEVVVLCCSSIWPAGIATASQAANEFKVCVHFRYLHSNNIVMVPEGKSFSQSTLQTINQTNSVIQKNLQWSSRKRVCF